MTTTPNPAPVTTSDAERAALLPCPFCGADAHTHTAPFDGWFAGCNICDFSLGEFLGESGAIAAWNRRAALPIDFKQATDQGGWQWVPKEPTDDMLLAAEISGPRGYSDLYAVMLAAAPTLQGVADGDSAATPSVERDQ